MSITFTAAGDNAPQVNVHVGNAEALFDLLGLTFDGDTGEVTAEDFLGRVLLAQALLGVTFDDVQGTPAVEDGRWYTGGRRPGQLAMRLGELHQVATWAHQAGAAVVWG